MSKLHQGFSQHLKNALIALAFGIIIGVPVGNAIAEALQVAKAQEMQIEKSTTAAATVLALLMQNCKKRKKADQGASKAKGPTKKPQRGFGKS